MNTPAPASAEAITARKVVTVPVTLQEPIEREGSTISQLILRKPRAGEMRGLKLGELINADVGSVIALVPRICDPFLTEAEVADLAPEDLAEIAGTITGFFMTPAQKAMMAQMQGTAA